MLYQNILLHNVTALYTDTDKEGAGLQRIPEAVRLCLNEKARQAYRSLANCELRFVLLGDEAFVTLSSPDKNAGATVYFGDFYAYTQPIGNEPVTLTLKKHAALAACGGNITGNLFSPDVVRVMLHRGCYFLNAVTGDVRPPRPDELPQKTLLTYGTSITHGHLSTSPVLSYAQLTAWRLGFDLINLGTGASAFCEKEIADYMAGLQNWDAAVLCISVNMLNQGFPPSEFKTRAQTLIHTLAGSMPDKPVVCMGLLPCYRDFGYNPRAVAAKPNEFRDILSALVQASGLPNVYYVDGRELMPPQGLSCDILHPGDLGTILLSENLAGFIRKIGDEQYV